MTPEDRNFYVSLGWHVVAAGFVVYLTITGQMPVATGMLAFSTIAGLALPSTIVPKPPTPAPPAP